MAEETTREDSGTGDRIRRVLFGVLAVAVVLAIWGVTARVGARRALADETGASATAVVSTTRPTRGAGAEMLSLPGTVKAYYEAPIYARTSGYVKSWRANIGMHVRRGELLAEIDAPELDQQLHQAEADLGTATANYEVAKATNERWKGLVGTGAVSRQDADQKAGDAAARKAAMASASANLARLRELAAFKRVVAPFDGIVTQRNTDIGMLIGSGPGPALFQVSDTHRLRVYVSVPEPYAALVHPGLSAQVSFPEHPGKLYDAEMAYTAGALDPVSRTLQVELQIDNRQGELLPGAYAEVRFGLAEGSATLRLPINCADVPRRRPAGGRRGTGPPGGLPQNHAGPRFRYGGRGAVGRRARGRCDPQPAGFAVGRRGGTDRSASSADQALIGPPASQSAPKAFLISELA